VAPDVREKSLEQRPPFEAAFLLNLRPEGGAFLELFDWFGLQ
jgi:hypothetical protein